MPRREEILSNMRVYLQSQDPQWDISPGTPEFKILEAVAQQLENVSLDGLLSTYHFDIDKKAGSELDLFLSLFGFYRQRSRRATGVVILRRGTDAPTDLSIPIGTQVFSPATNNNPSVYFSTTAAAIINQGERQVVVPIEATVGGTTGNVPAFSINSFSSSANNVTEVYNPVPTSGGSNSESDDSFRERFRRTFLRSVAGTENQFAGIALAETGTVNKVSVISPVENYREQIQFYPINNLTSSTPYQITNLNDEAQLGNFPSIDDFTEGEGFLVASFDNNGFKALHRFTFVDNEWDPSPALPAAYTKLLVAYESSVRDAKYVFPPGSEIVGVNLNTSSEVLAKPNFLDPKLEIADYSMIVSASSAPTQVNYPVFVFSPSGVIRLGGPESVITAQFEYTPVSSRNNPPNVMNKMDLYVHGKDEINLNEQIHMVHGTSSTFSTASSSSLFYDDFVREDGITNPKPGNLFTLIGRTPVISIPSSISVNRFIGDTEDLGNMSKNLDASQIYYKDEDYWFVNKSTIGGEYNVFTGTRRSIEGIEWNTPLTATLDGDATYAKPINSSSDSDAPLAAYQSNYSGRLNGYYAYVFTWEAEGKESLPSNPVSVNAVNANVAGKQVLVHLQGTESTYVDNEIYTDLENSDSTSIYRKIYRSKAAASATEAEQGPFYLVKVIRNNDAGIYWMDNTADDNLGFTTPPKPPPPNGAPISLNYTYNGLIERLDNRMDLVRLVGQDIMTHQAKEVPVKFNLAIVAALNSNFNSVRSGVASALNRFLGSKSFGSDIQKADLIAAIETATEVDNVRLLSEGEESNEVFEIQISSPSELTNTDNMSISVDEFSTSTLTANEEGYIIREALEALPNFEAGDTYASFLTSAFGLKGQDNFLQDSSVLTVWNNSNAQRIADMVDFVNANSYGDVYLQITQAGNDNLHKDEIVKVVSYNNTDVNFNDDAFQYGYVADGVSKAVSFSASTVYANNHGFINQQPIRFTGFDGSIGLSSSSTYYVTQATSNTFKLSTSISSSSAITFATSSTSTGTAITQVATGIIKKFSVLSSSPGTGNNIILQTVFHGLDEGQIVKLFDVNSNLIGSSTGYEIISTTNNSITFEATDLTSSQLNNVKTFTVQIAEEGYINFEVIRGQLGSVKRNYGNGTDSINNDVLRAGSEAWIHLIGDVAVAKNASSNNKEITYTVSLIPNILQTFIANQENSETLIKVNNWGSRSLFDENNTYRASVTTGGNASSSVVRKTAGLGSGIQILALNKRNIISTTYEDVYFDSNEVLTLGGLDIVLRARNTFNA